MEIDSYVLIFFLLLGIAVFEMMLHSIPHLKATSEANSKRGTSTFEVKEGVAQ
jgi:hypothetical protein